MSLRDDLAYCRRDLDAERNRHATALAMIRDVLDFAHKEYAIRSEINDGAEGHTYENGWCDALAGVLDAMGLDVRDTSPSTAERP
jgi:hypothetical protein